MSAPAIAKQLGVDRSTVYRLLGWRPMAEPASILPAPPEEIYPLMIVRMTPRAERGGGGTGRPQLTVNDGGD